MDNYFYRQLSKDTQALVDIIEKEISDEIQITLRKEKNNYGCIFKSGRVTIFAPRLDRLRDGPMIHELLHIKRRVIEDTPALEVADHKINDPDFCRNISDLDNSIEHLAIVHQEIALWPDRKSYWGKILHRELRHLISRQIVTGDIKGHAILCWSLTNRSVPSKKLLRAWKSFFEVSGIYDLVDSSSKKILATTSKKAIVKILLAVIGIPLLDIEIF